MNNQEKNFMPFELDEFEKLDPYLNFLLISITIYSSLFIQGTVLKNAIG